MNTPLCLSVLKPGDTIGVMAPSSYVEKEDIKRSKALLEQRGLKVFVHPQTYERQNQSAGNHLQKSLAFQGLWTRDDIQCIWAAGGGNRALHLLDTINFERLKSKPKTLIGFSDVSALLNAIYAHTNIPSIHGPVFKALHKYEQLDHLLDMLHDKKPQYPSEDFKVLIDGTGEGHLIGGNLSIFQYLPSILPRDFYEGGILFLEDCNEELSKIDRMLLHLKQLGVFEKIHGLIFGQFTSLQDNGRAFGYTLEDIINEHTMGFNIPVVMNAPFGHGNTLYSLPIGLQAQLDTKNAELNIIYKK